MAVVRIVGDVAQASLYRHMSILAEAGLLEVVSERQRRGGTERTYRLVEESAALGPEEAAAMSSEEHLSGFVTFSGALIEAFGRYLDASESDPSRDVVGYRQVAVWLTPEEATEMTTGLLDALAPFLANEPDPKRERILLSTILMPDASVS